MHYADRANILAVKLLLPGRMTELDRTLSAALNRNMDVKAVFAAVGELFTREGGAASAAEEVYRAVFQPEVGEADKTSADSTDTPLALTELKAQIRLQKARDSVEKLILEVKEMEARLASDRVCERRTVDV